MYTCCCNGGPYITNVPDSWEGLLTGGVSRNGGVCNPQGASPLLGLWTPFLCPGMGLQYVFVAGVGRPLPPCPGQHQAGCRSPPPARFASFLGVEFTTHFTGLLLLVNSAGKFALKLWPKKPAKRAGGACGRIATAHANSTLRLRSARQVTLDRPAGFGWLAGAARHGHVVQNKNTSCRQWHAVAARGIMSY